jgi:hypothetical protein
MQRKPRAGSIVPLGLIEAEEANIKAAVRDWCAGWHPEGFSSEASFLVLEKMFFRLLRDNHGTLDAAVVVDQATRGHVPADRALRRLIQMAIETDTFQALPVSVRAYAGRIVALPPLTEYPSQASQVVNHFLRDSCLVVLMRRVKASWPGVPLLNSSGRASVAALVGPAFGVSERQARRIYQADNGLARRVIEFLMSRPNGELPYGSGHKESGG